MNSEVTISDWSDIKTQMEHMNEVDATIQWAMDKAINQAVYKAAQLKVQMMLDGDIKFNNKALKWAQDVNDQYKTLQKKKVTSHYYWVTVNSKQGTDLTKFMKKVEGYCNRVMIGGAIYSIEFDGCPEERGPHAHILCYNVKDTDSDFRKNTLSTFKTFFGDKAKLSSVLKIKVVKPTVECIHDKMNYAMGNKWKQEKDESVIYNRMTRELYGLQDFYITKSFEELIETPII